MVIVKLKGGLGNQMFQYAAGRRLAHVLGAELKLDISGFVNCHLRKYELDSFDIVEKFAAPQEVEKLSSQKSGFLSRQIQSIFRKPREVTTSHIRQLYFHFDPNILDLSDNVYLDGYWQSEKYFADVSEIIMREFTIKAPQTDQNRKLAESITSCNAVSVHIRRGDYVSNPITHQILGVCSFQYYQTAIKKLAATVSQPHLFVFSDDIKWAKRNLKLAYPTTFINNRYKRDCEDMRLMKQCKYHVIANSSFSWWGAWLCTHPSKIVIAPKEWFNEADYDTTDLIPANWQQI